MRRINWIVLTMLIVSIAAQAQNLNRRSIEGVWKVAEIVTTGSGAARISDPQPGLIMIGEKYYSFMYIPGDKERSPFAGDVVTQQEKLDAFDSFFANAGTYEISGSTMTVTPTVAKNPGFEGGGFARYSVRVEGKTLWLSNGNNDFSFRRNGKVLPAGGPASETTIKFVRVE